MMYWMNRISLITTHLPKTDKVKVSCLAMSDSLQPHILHSPWNSPGQNTAVGSLSVLQGIFPTQGSNPGLLHCRCILLPAEPQGKPKNTGVGSLTLLQWIFPTQESNQSLLHYRQILYELSCQGGPRDRQLNSNHKEIIRRTYWVTTYKITGLWYDKFQDTTRTLKD